VLPDIKQIKGEDDPSEEENEDYPTGRTSCFTVFKRPRFKASLMLNDDSGPTKNGFLN
jgi:hypothetical protein